MRILELISTLEQGGAEQITSSLALGLRRKGHDVFLVCLRDEGFMPVPKHQFEAAGIELVALNKSDGLSVSALRALAGYAESRRVDIIHTHNPLVNHYGAAAAKLACIPVLVNTIHGISTLDMPSWAKWLYRISCMATSRVVSVCEAVNRSVRSQFRLSSKHCTVIPNGVDISQLVALPNRVPDGRFVFGTMARLVPVKDHASLLKAFAVVRSLKPNCYLKILGDGELEAALKNQARDLGLGDSVLFQGWSSAIGGFLETLDVFVLSSISEGLPLTVLEAMAAARPIVATAVGGVPEIIEASGCGWLCPAGDSLQFAAAMIRAMDSSLLTEIGERGREAATRFYSDLTMVDMYEGLFSRLLERGLPVCG